MIARVPSYFHHRVCAPKRIHYKYKIIRFGECVCTEMCEYEGSGRNSLSQKVIHRVKLGYLFSSTHKTAHIFFVVTGVGCALENACTPLYNVHRGSSKYIHDITNTAHFHFVPLCILLIHRLIRTPLYLESGHTQFGWQSDQMSEKETVSTSDRVLP